MQLDDHETQQEQPEITTDGEQLSIVGETQGADEEEQQHEAARHYDGNDHDNVSNAVQAADCAPVDDEEDDDMKRTSSAKHAAVTVSGEGGRGDSDDMIETVKESTPAPNNATTCDNVSNQQTEVTETPSREEVKKVAGDVSVSPCVPERKGKSTEAALPGEPSKPSFWSEPRDALSLSFSSSLGRPSILSLPMDSLHHVASFLTPVEWCEFGLSNRTAHRVSREIVRRVRMHGFKCATEVVTAWKLGHHEDAKELTALYISSGVPIYPRCLGHSYHTLLWRMGVEAKDMESDQLQQQQPQPPQAGEPPSLRSVDDPAPSSPRVDQFYFSRSEFRAREGYSSSVTYLEEKSFFWLEKQAGGGMDSTHRRAFGPGSRRALSPNAEAEKELLLNRAKVYIPIHQHLHDQHVLGRYAVDDHDGGMVTPKVSLSVDFYHPAMRSSASRTGSYDREERWLFGEAQSLTVSVGVDASQQHLEASGMNSLSGFTDENRTDNNQGDSERAAELSDQPNLDAAEILAVAAAPAGDSDDEMLFESQQPIPTVRFAAARERIELDYYSSSLNGAGKEVTENLQELKRHMKSRFTTYKRRLENLLSQGKNNGFEECVLDFWDEFLPHTASIHYFDRSTAVPRMSCLHKFLTKPCPKAIGIVQCEIERIKINMKGKGVSMKGRLFPTYEYRLFIRNRPHTAVPESASMDEEDFTRRDTVLMVAKNRGRKHAQVSGVSPLTTASKKGSNNYFLYVPHQSDVDEHFNKVNEHSQEEAATMVLNGASHDPALLSEDAGSVLLGRLQSNFIGTEFQIFTPRIRKRPKYKMEAQGKAVYQSDEDPDYDSGLSSDTPSRRSRFGRLSLRRTTLSASDSSPESATNMEPSSMRSRKHPVKRTTSCPDMQQGRHSRTNRRAIANTPATDTKQPEHDLCEEEDGAITYTANLLGSRPRIMDVCVPKVTVEGVQAAEWRRYLEACDDTDDCRMLSCFRQLLHRLENQDGVDGVQNDNDSDAAGEDNNSNDFGLVALQNRPPWWNIELGSFVLNFGGRVSVASVKNFQLCDRRDQDRIMLQFGRIHGRHSFTMDFQHPLTAVQAFSIAISSLQSKISFG